MDFATSKQIVDAFHEKFVGKKFYGQYAERRYVSKINCYRDLILIDKNEAHIQKLIDDVLTYYSSLNSTGELFLYFVDCVQIIKSQYKYI